MKNITTLVAFVGGFAFTLPAPAQEASPPLPLAAEAAPQSSASAAYLEHMREVIFYALTMVGINYRWGGTSPQTGFDCSGLVNHVFRHIAGLVLPRDSYAMARLGKPVAMDDLRPGDLVFFNTMRRPFSHVGIYLGDRRFIHAPTAGKTVQLVDMNEAYWAKRYNGARRIDL